MVSPILIILSCSVVHTLQWTYKEQDQWPDLCKTGKSQSPINLDAKHAVEANFTKFVFNHYNVGYPAVVKNNGHSITVKIATPYPSISGGGLPFNEYILDHLHFHWNSEHTLRDFRYPLELHAVHFAKQFENLTGALNHRGGVAVLGVFYDFSPDDDVEFSQLTDVMNNLILAPNTGVSHMEGVFVKRFLPRDTAGYFRYEGSLTTPNCNEVVVWTVFTNVISISEEQVKQFLSVELEEGVPKINYRPVQDIGGRVVYQKVSPLHRNSAGILNYSNYMVVIFVALVIKQQY